MKRTYLAVLPAAALLLALGGCGGPDGDKKAASAAPSAPASSPQAAGTPSIPAALPTMPTTKAGQKAAATRFNNCMEQHGVKLPKPGPGASAAAQQNKDKVQAALRECIAALSGQPSAKPK
ncbi:hypothetical protein [Actinomadura atramentaria]|uniref:hypothetical protein n=1 Tax=Actinomadura atramentaria TaxID=1990 RepID=UPI0003737090|nr:hypothetical protein [Actinomadura atramentaria]